MGTHTFAAQVSDQDVPGVIANVTQVRQAIEQVTSRDDACIWQATVFCGQPRQELAQVSQLRPEDVDAVSCTDFLILALTLT